MLMGMNCDDEKTVVISPTSTTNEWPQNMISNDHSHNSMINNKNTMAHSSTPQQPQDHPHQQQQQQQSLKCPRCDSANTKFCYYNNYSLSQPRHFCKACKRYWTRGGTLRNVPVGGGCRKNKRLKRPSSSSSSAAATSSSGIVPSLINSGDSHIDQLTGSNPSHVGSSLFYGSNHEISLPFSSSRYEQPHHLSSALGLGFSSNNGDGGYQSSLLSSYGSIFGGSSSPTIASLLASKFSNGTGFQALAPFEELNIAGINGGHGDRYNNNNNNNKQGVKVESGGQGRSSSSALGWINGVGVGGGNNSATNNQADQIGLSSDPSLYWPANPTAVGGGNWLDPMASLGSNNSVPSLI